MEDVQQGHDAAGMGHEMQSVVSLRIGDVGICTVRDEELDDVNVSITGGPLHGSSNKVTTEGVDLRALFEEVSTRRKLRIDGCPVKGGDVLGVSVGRRGCARLDEVSDDVHFSTLSGDEDVYLKGCVRRRSVVNEWAEEPPRGHGSSGSGS